LTESSPTESDSSTHSRFGSARARPTTAVRSYSVSRLRRPVSRAGSSTVTRPLLHDLRNLASTREPRKRACMLRPMLEPDDISSTSADPPEEGAVDMPAGPPASADPPSARESTAESLQAEPAPVDTRTRTYELPSARRVVSVGLQLALGSSVPIRR